MAIETIVAIVGTAVTGIGLLGGIGALLYRSGQSEARSGAGRTEIVGKLDVISDHLDKLNGQVADVVERSHENAGKIAALEGRQEERDNQG